MPVTPAIPDTHSYLTTPGDTQGMLEGDLSVSIGDDAVEFTYTIENTGSDPVTANYRDGQKFDIFVTDGDQELWRWSHGRMFTMALEQRTFDPGERVSYSGTWNDPEPGSYTAVATCAANTIDARAETSFEV